MDRIERLTMPFMLRPNPRLSVFLRMVLDEESMRSAGKPYNPLKERDGSVDVDRTPA